MPPAEKKCRRGGQEPVHTLERVEADHKGTAKTGFGKGEEFKKQSGCILSKEMVEVIIYGIQTKVRGGGQRVTSDKCGETNKKRIAKKTRTLRRFQKE